MAVLAAQHRQAHHAVGGDADRVGDAGLLEGSLDGGHIEGIVLEEEDVNVFGLAHSFPA
ncbi:hypothetical protein D3C83_298860 [compost metagenome]